LKIWNVVVVVAAAVAEVMVGKSLKKYGINKNDKNMACKYWTRVSHEIRLTKQDDYFWVDFDHFRIE